MAGLEILKQQLGCFEEMMGVDSIRCMRMLKRFKESLDGMPLQADDLSSLAIKLRELHSRALEARDSVEGETWEVLDQVLARASAQARAQAGTLSGTLFDTPVQYMPKVQLHLIHWFREGMRLCVQSKEDLLKDVDSSLVAIRWLSFRVAIREDPKPLHQLAGALAACRKRKAPKSKEDRIEQENLHYNLVDAICIHAASGQSGISVKRLARAANEGEGISVVIDNAGDRRQTGIELKRVLNKDIVGSTSGQLHRIPSELRSDFQNVLAQADVIKEQIYSMLAHHNWTGHQVGGLIVAHLLFCVDVNFVDGLVDQLTLSPGFPSVRGSKDAMLQLYERERLYKSSDPAIVFDVMPPDGFKGLVLLMSKICLVNEVPCEPLWFVTDNGVVLDVVVGHELVYSGSNSVVLSCKNRNEERPSSVLKVAPAAASQREELFYDKLHKVPGVRCKIASGYVKGAGAGLRFIQLTGFGAELGRGNVDDARLKAWAEQACTAIRGMHELGVLHCDIKPSNFIVLGDLLLLNDFDISCEHHETFSRCIAVGTLMFKSPRLMDAFEEYQQVDDWMSLGLTFMYLTGAHHSGLTTIPALNKLLDAPWAPDILKFNVSTGLELVAAAEAARKETETEEARMETDDI